MFEKLTLYRPALRIHDGPISDNAFLFIHINA